MPQQLRVLHVASEAVPFVKTGGLADVVAALPKALPKHKVEARIVIPGYSAALRKAEELGGLEWLPGDLTIEAGGVDHRIGVGAITVEGVTYYLLACNELFAREGLYGPAASVDYDDNARRFAVFSKAALALPHYVGWIPHVVHAHDWQAGLIPVLLQRGFQHDLPATRSVFTIHNIAYQGAFWHWDLRLTGLDWSLYNPLQLEQHERLNCLKAGIVFADRVTTVSKRYAEEIQTAEFGYGLDGAIREHQYKLTGITNGIDVDEWDPGKDPHLPANYTAAKLAGKQTCKQALRKELNLTTEGNPALVGVVSRLVWQKGIDLLIEAVSPYILAGRMQLAVLGTGDPDLEHRLRQLQGKHPGYVCFWHGYNEGLAHRIEAGSDIFAMPSRFEPCGLNQMYSLRYGTLPIVRHTGGLADTVSDVVSGAGNGFTFGPMDLGHFSSVLDRALGLYAEFPAEWTKAVKRAMKGDNSWNHVAAEYADLYRKISMI
ncbi:MAG: glycogen synthase GlgA [Planctomycetota bacterium]|jgi:starch synthase|nr:glycogen synthase GlgA [Planctomycetota bacterium]